MRNGQLSFWLSGPGSPKPPTTSALATDDSVDVAIVGGGFSGLWTAWSLLQADPSLNIAVFEANRLGYGASGRNGGMLSTKPVGIRSVLAKGPGGRDAVLAIEAQMRESMEDIVAILGAENIDAEHGGWIQVARSRSEQLRMEKYVEYNRSWGFDETRLWQLSAKEAYARIHATKLTGAMFSPENYSVNPAKMLFELARLTIAAGAKVYTDSPVTSIDPRVLTVGGAHAVRARQIIVATEGYTSLQAGQKRQTIPLNSSLVATEPLTEAQWEKVGWSQYESFSGLAHTYFYAKRTSDGRIAVGGRGRPYRFGSRFDRNGELDPQTVSALMAVLAELFPEVSLEPSHAWCGVLGMPRDWTPYIDRDESTGITRIGGYVGLGVGASHVAAQTVTSLLTGRDDSFAHSPWVRPAPRRWEPEPLRWLGANGLYAAYSLADQIESRSSSSRTTRIALLADKIAGR